MQIRITDIARGAVDLSIFRPELLTTGNVELHLSLEAIELLADLLVLWKNRKSLPGDIRHMSITDDGTFQMSGQLFEKGDPVVNV